MATAERSLLVNVGVKNAGKATADLLNFGTTGDKAFRKIGDGARPASAELLKFDSVVQGSGLSLQNLAGRAGAAGGALASLGPIGLGVAAGLGAAYAGVHKFNDAVDKADGLVKLSDRVGVSVERMQELRFAGARTGREIQEIDNAVENFNRRVGEAANGTGEAAKTFDNLGVSVRDANGAIRPTDELFLEVADAIASMSTQAEKGAAAQKLFEETGLRLLNFFDQGSEKIRAMGDEARALGLILDEDLARGAERVRDSVDVASEIIDTNLNRAFLGVAPLIADVTDAFADLVEVVGKFELVAGGRPDLDLISSDALKQERADLEAEIAEIEATIQAAISAGEKQFGSGGRKDIGTDAVSPISPLVDAVQYDLVVLTQMQQDLAGVIAEIKKRGLEDPVNDNDPDTSGSDGQVKKMREELDKLRQVLDPVAKLEAERAAALAKVAKNSKALTDGERLKFEAEIEEYYDQRIKDLDKTSEGAEKEAREIEKLTGEYRRLTGELDPVVAAQNQFADGSELLSDLLGHELISLDQYVDGLEKLERQYDKATAAASNYGDTANEISRIRAPQADGINDFVRLGAGEVFRATDTSRLGSSLANVLQNQALDNVLDYLPAINKDGSLTLPSIPTGGTFLSNLGVTVAEQLGLTTSVLTPAGTQVALSGGGQALAGGIAAAPWGAVGSFGATLLGLNSGNIAIDALAGVGGSVAGGALGSALGFAGGGPIGAVLGSFLATALGGALFGADEDFPYSNTQIDLTGGKAKRDGTIELDGGPVKEIQELADSVAGAVTGIFDELGAELSDLDDLARVGFSSGRKSTLPKGIFIGGLDGKLGGFNEGANFTGIEETGEAFARGVQVSLLSALREGAVSGLEDDVAETLRAGLENAVKGEFTDQESALADIEFLATFDQMIGSVGMTADLLAQQNDVIERAAKDRAKAETDYIEDFLERTNRLFEGDEERIGQGQETVRQYAIDLVDQVVGIEPTTEALTGMALALKTGEEEIRALEDALISAGLSAEEAADVIEDGIGGLGERIREDFDKSIATRIASIRSPDAANLIAFANDIEDLQEQAEAVGGDMEAVNELIRLQAEALSGEAEARRQSTAETLAATEAAVAANRAYAESLDGLVSRLRTGSSSVVLSDTAKLSDLQSQLDAAIALADDENASAAERNAARQSIDGISASIFQLSQDLYASGAEAVSVQKSTLSKIEGLASRVRTQIDVGEDQLEVLRAIEQNTKPRADADRDFGINSTRNKLLADLFPEFTGNFGAQYGGLFGQFFSTVSDNDPRRAAAEQIISAVGYESGGDHLGGLRVVGEGGMEIEATGRSRILPNREVRQALFEASQYRAVAGGGQDLVRLVSAVEKLTGAVTRQTAEFSRTFARLADPTYQGVF